MVMAGRRCFLMLAAMAAAFGPFTERAGASEKLDLHMVMTMAGVTAGTIKLSIDEQETQTVSSISMKSQGLFKFLTGYESLATAESADGVDGASPMPISYELTYETNNGERRVEIRYDRESGDIDTLGNWRKGKPRDSKVPAALQAATVDPLTAMVRFRHWIRELRAEGGFQKIGAVEPAPKTRNLEVFDGRRRYRLEIDLLERIEIDHAGSRVPALRFRVDLETLAGFGRNDMLANWSSENGQRWIEVIVTDDDRTLPISMSTIGGSLKTTVYLRKICDGRDSCTKVSG